MLKLYNSLTRKKEPFTPLKALRAGIYVCGPTVYAPCHLGHARTWLFFDWLRRYLTYKKFKVTFVQNITDVGHLVGDAETGEDKIEKEAKAKSKTPAQIARFYEEKYFADLKSLNILLPDVSPRASEHIGEMIEYIKVLLKKGHAYEKAGNVYFDVTSISGYGALSGRKIQDSLVDTRVKADPLKKHQADFALWLKAEKHHLQKWSSPWGDGFPGWHLECSVLSAKYLGQPFDIHGSASELIFPHHENELAQSLAYAEKPLAKYWLHTGMLLIAGQKMSKSLGNYITIEQALEKYDVDTIKLAFMSAFWRKPFDWPDASFSSSISEAQDALKEARKLKERILRAKMSSQSIKTGFPTELEGALDDDFNLPKALKIILANLSQLSKMDFELIENIFGLNLRDSLKLTKIQEKMVKQREKARESGDFKKADAIRKTLAKKGIVLEDTSWGTRIIKN